MSTKAPITSIAPLVASCLLLLLAGHTPSSAAGETGAKRKIVLESDPQTKTNPVDGSEMIWIPAGEFIMGDDSPPMLERDEKPAHKVYLDGYYIFKDLVSVAQYRKFCDATGRSMPPPPSWGWGNPNFPMVHVTWNDAAAYSAWAGGYLPTEAQWEKAARGTDGRKYPWGNTWDASRCANSVSTGLGTPQPIGSHPSGASPYGVLDMAGEMWEWCSDWYDKDYYRQSPNKNPTGPPSGDDRVCLRGGSFYDTSPNYFSCVYRYNGIPEDQYYDIYGFRCIVPADASFPAVPTVQTPALGATITDKFVDWSKIGGKVGGWGFESNQPASFLGNTQRATRLGDDQAALVYRYPDIIGFRATVFTWECDISSVHFYVSRDGGASFAPLDVITGNRTPTPGAWGYYVITPANPLPAGVNALEIEFTPTGTPWDPQLAEVSITQRAASK